MLEEAKRRCPVNTGALRDSGRAVLGEEKDLVSARIVFGNGEVDYALFVHENLEAHQEDGKMPHFLSSVLPEAAPHVAERVAARLNQR